MRQAVKNKRTVSAYLLSGPAGIGKKTICRAFAAALLCENPIEGAACGGCVSCRLLAAESHPDLIRLGLPADKKSIGVELVREKLIKEAAIRPFTAQRKVFVVEAGEAMTPEAQNALLKVLEEPPQYVVFIILAAAQSSLLETVLSRSLKLQLLPLSATLCQSYFSQKTEGTPQRRELAASFCQGILGRGERMLTDDAFYELYQKTVAKLAQLPQSRAALSEMLQFLTENKGQIEDITDFMLL
ncbi:MAG: DNA polymerase III subunit delta', partial [Clostridia bacterium]|nr:DNA polymerase III subunit delta' [Clostridia bacterium]